MENANHGTGQPEGSGGPGQSGSLKENVLRSSENDPPGGRPAIVFDLAQLEKLCHINATQREIAAFFGCSVDTIQNRIKSDPKFADAVERGYCGGWMSLRRKQMEVALDGNPTMLIWMGKQLLGQRDSTSLEHSGPGGTPLMDVFTARALLHADPDSE